MSANKVQIVASLVKAYNMEVETVLNYLANSLDLEGVRAEFIKQALATDIQEEMGHAQQLGHRIKQLGGSVPGSLALQMEQRSLQPPADTTDVVDVGFADLVPPERVVQLAVFEADDPSYAGTMTMTWHLAAAGDGTEVTVTATDVPLGIDQAAHEAGIASSLDNLASYVEGAG